MEKLTDELGCLVKLLPKDLQPSFLGLMSSVDDLNDRVLAKDREIERLRNIERAAIMVDVSSQNDDFEIILAYIAGLHVVLKDNPRPDGDRDE